MSVFQQVLNKKQYIRRLPKILCTCQYQTFVRKWSQNDKTLSIPRDTAICGRRRLLWQQERYAGHSKWQNIKFKKMHKDNARAKVFGRLSLEIIQSVKESGANTAFNPKLEALIIKAKASSMPKDRIETSIKNALRHSDEKLSRVLHQARGPGRCGLMIDCLTPNPVRVKAEIRQILKRKDAIYIDDGTVASQFIHKGVLEVEAITSTGDITDDEKAEAEEIAIMIGAEDIYFDEDERNSYQFICEPLEIYNLKKALATEYDHLEILSAETQYIAKSLMTLTEELMGRADRVIDIISDHPDVVNVYDNIVDYPSKTIKRVDQYG